MSRDPELTLNRCGKRRGRMANSLSVNRLYAFLGNGRAMPAVVTVVAVVGLVLTGCGKDGGEAGGAGGAKVANAANRRGPQQPPVPVAVEAARTGTISSYYSATATLAAEKAATILARANGVITDRLVEEGDLVDEGTNLLQIEDDEYRLRLAQAESNTAKLKDRYERLQGMWDEQLVSAEEFEAAKNEFKAAEAEEEIARLNLSYTTVTAPFTGRIVERMVDVGQNVSIGTELFRISDFDPLLAIVHVPSKEFKKLRPDQPVDLTLDSTKDKLKGRIKLVSPIIDPTSGTIKVTIEIPRYPPNTRPGDFAEVSIVTEVRSNRILVPKVAVFADQGDRVIYVAADSTAERRVVEVGFEDDENAEILSGVTDGEPIVVKGQRSLKHGQAIKILGDEEENKEEPSSNEEAAPKAGA